VCVCECVCVFREADDKIRNILDGKEVPNYIYTYICLWV